MQTSAIAKQNRKSKKNDLADVDISERSKTETFRLLGAPQENTTNWK